MPVPIALAIAGIASSLAAAKMQADAQNQSAAMTASGGAAGQGGGIDLETGTNKHMNTIRALNEGNTGNVYDEVGQSFLSPGKTDHMEGVQGQSFLQPGSQDHMSKIAMGGEPSGNVMGMDGAGGGGGEGGGGFNMDNALQYSALAAQLGSMFAPPPPPAAPRGGGGMNVNVQPFTMRMMGGR